MPLLPKESQISGETIFDPRDPRRAAHVRRRAATRATALRNNVIAQMIEVMTRRC